MNPPDIIQNFMDIVTKHYFDFQGRARRTVYWYFFLVNVIISIIFNVLASFVPAAGIISLIVSLALLLPGIGVAVRRMHDSNRSGWWVLAPFYNIYLMCIPGTSGPNTYGADPKAA